MVKGIDVRVCGHEHAGSLAVCVDQGMCCPRDGVLYESKELDHVPVDEREVNRLVSLASNRTKDPVRPVRIHTRKAAG